MATISNRTEADTVVLLKQAAGIALIPKPTDLTRLNYFDGKFLRAADLQAEQEYHRRLQQLAASAGGGGVVHGFDLQLLAGDQIDLGVDRDVMRPMPIRAAAPAPVATIVVARFSSSFPRSSAAHRPGRPAGYRAGCC